MALAIASAMLTVPELTGRRALRSSAPVVAGAGTGYPGAPYDAAGAYEAAACCSAAPGGYVGVAGLWPGAEPAGGAR